MKKSVHTYTKFYAKPSQRGIVLLEAMIAVLLFSMGVLALVGLQATMMKNTDDAKLRAEASNIAQAWIGMMWANPDPAKLANYAIANGSDSRFDIPTLPHGTRTVQVLGTGLPNSTTQVTVTINWQQPGKPQHQFISVANIAGG